MTEHPILFSAPMVRAILEGRKSQTRRVAPITDLHIKQYCDDLVSWGVTFSKVVKGVLGSYSGGRFTDDQARRIIASQFNPYGQPGDRLWVREAHWMDRRDTTLAVMNVDGYVVAQNGRETGRESNPEELGLNHFWRLRPSIHMPRWASRILLEVIGVRVERLNDISEADAIAEGLYRDQAGRLTTWSADANGREFMAPIPAYEALWNQINGPGSWSANPWVWVVEFKRVTP